jgi:hypothetical protein
MARNRVLFGLVRLLVITSVPTKRRALVWAGRIALAAAVLLAAVGLVAPTFRPTEMRIGPDQVSHGLIIYVVTLLSALAFPRVSLLLMALLFGTIAAAVELAQFLAILPGAAQTSDLLADLVGILAALGPMAVIRARRAAREAARGSRNS